MSKPSPRAPRAVAAADRRTEILKDRAAGMTFAQIAAKNKISIRRARTIVAEEFARLTDERGEVAARLLETNVRRLDDLLEAVWDDALEGDTKSVTAALAVIDRQSRLLGLDAPSRAEARVQFQGIVGEMDLDARAQALGISLEALRGPEPPALPDACTTPDIAN